MNWLDAHLLTVVTFLPLATGLLLILLRGLPEQVWKVAAVGATTLTFLLSLMLWFGFDPTRTGYQFVEYAAWLPSWGVHYFVGIDGMSLLLVMLTTFLMPLVLIASWNDPTRQVKSFVFFNLFLETGMIGAFLALNVFQFYLFWELMLVPMYFIIGIWGGPRRVYAAVKFFLFTMVGSLLMLVAILVIYSLHQQQFGVASFDLVRHASNSSPALLDTTIPLAGQAVWWKTQPWLFAAFALAFGIKVPIVPFHTWLPDAHTEAPTAGSVVLAGVLLKMGTYGFVRFALPLFPVATEQAAPLIFGLALLGILYGALVAMVQSDIKKLVAYSSVAHLGFVMLGIFALNEEGLEGSILQMVNHGLSTGALFLLVGMLYERRHTREIAAFGGIAKPMPVFALLFGIVAMSSIGLPGLNGFVGEFLILAGTFVASPWVGATATLGVVLAAAYLLWAYRRVFFGPVEEPENRSLIDLSFREMFVVLAVLIPIVWIGVAPSPFLRRLDASVGELLHQMEQKKAVARSPQAVFGAQRGEAERSSSGPEANEVHRVVSMNAPRLDLAAIAPIAFTGFGALVVLLGEVWLSRRKTFLGREVTEIWIGTVLALLSAVFLGLAIYAAGATFAGGASITFDIDNPMLRLDAFAAYATALIGLASFLVCWLSIAYLAELRINHGEYYALILLSTAGMFLLVGSIDLLALFLGLELMSIPLYVLAGFDRRNLRSNESSFKYFLVGSFASAILLYGIALIYGVTGAFDFESIRKGFPPGNPLGTIGLALVIVGFAFKVAATPFHQWAPDVYEGAPTSVTAFMAITVKVAAFMALLRLLTQAFGPVAAGLNDLFWVLATATIVIGNLMALIQNNLKRLLAYSSIAHAGYILIGFATGSIESYGAVLFYLLVYVFTNLGAFAVLVALSEAGHDCDSFDDLAGLARQRPGLAALLTIFALSLAGIPGTAGFVAKFVLFKAAVASGETVLAIIGVLGSLVSVYYYLRLPVVMYMTDAKSQAPRREASTGELLVLAVCVAVVLFLGFFPSHAPGPFGGIRALEWARQSVALLY